MRWAALESLDCTIFKQVPPVPIQSRVLSINRLLTAICTCQWSSRSFRQSPETEICLWRLLQQTNRQSTLSFQVFVSLGKTSWPGTNGSLATHTACKDHWTDKGRVSFTIVILSVTFLGTKGVGTIIRIFVHSTHKVGVSIWTAIRMWYDCRLDKTTRILNQLLDQRRVTTET